MAKVSVIIPCYNQAQYLPEAVESVINQTFTDWECIIVNDGSPDNTEEVALQLCQRDSRIRYFKKENGGLSSARNFGIERAAGEYILPLDADDKIDSTFLEKTVGVIEKNQHVKVVFTARQNFGEDGQLIRPKDVSFKTLLLYNYISPAALFRKNDFYKTEGYRINMVYGWEDWDFWLQMISYDSDIYLIDEPLFYYRVKKKSMLQNLISDEEKISKMQQTIFVNNLTKYLRYFPQPITVLREYIVLKQLESEFENYKVRIYNSWTYRLGDLLLKPFKLIRILFNQK